MATKSLELDVLFNETAENSNVGSFTLQPLERGYGTTIGNALRRVLLTSIPGAAITHIKIEGVQHEFSTIPGVKEDVADIIMNLKKVGIECRPGFYSLNRMKPFKKYSKGKYTNSNYLSANTISLPTTDLSKEEQKYIIRMFLIECQKII